MHELCSIVQVELAHQSKFVYLRRVDAEPEGNSDFFYGASFGQELQYFLFALAQYRDRSALRCGTWLCHSGDYKTFRTRTYAMQNVEQRSRRCILEHVGVGTGCFCCTDVLVISVHAQEDDRHTWAPLSQFPGDGEAADAGHRYIHQDNVRPEIRNDMQGDRGCLGLAYDLECGLRRKQRP